MKNIGKFDLHFWPVIQFVPYDFPNIYDDLVYGKIPCNVKKTFLLQFFSCRSTGLEAECVPCDGTGEVTCPICGGCGQTDDYEKQDVIRSICRTDDFGDCVEDLVTETVDIVTSVGCVQCNGEGRVICDTCQARG